MKKNISHRYPFITVTVILTLIFAVLLLTGHTTLAIIAYLISALASWLTGYFWEG